MRKQEGPKKDPLKGEGEKEEAVNKNSLLNLLITWQIITQPNNTHDSLNSTNQVNYIYYI